jgi:hypothetical protein
MIAAAIQKTGSLKASRFFMPQLFPTNTTGFSGVLCEAEAAEKRHPAETGCRFSGIAALPTPGKAPVYGGLMRWHGAC